jgi:hypothetical protein
MKRVGSASERSGLGKDFNLVTRVASLGISNPRIDESDFVTYGHNDPFDETDAAIAAWNSAMMSGWDDSGTTPDLSDTEFRGSIAGRLGPIEGSEG